MDGEGDLISWVIILASVSLALHRAVGKCLEPYQLVTVKTRNCLFVLATSSGPASLFTKGTKFSSPQHKQEHLFCSAPCRRGAFPGGDQLCCKGGAKVLLFFVLPLPASFCIPFSRRCCSPGPNPGTPRQLSRSSGCSHSN